MNIDVDVVPVGSEVPDVAVFYDRLSSDGNWYNDPVHGYVFVPSSTSYVPYSNGYWRLTDYGFTWISNDSFGWATDHYGRWVWRDRWVWRPDTTWGPAWVQWRSTDDAIGWAPAGYDDDFIDVPETYWRFVPASYVVSRDLPRYYTRAPLGEAQPIRRYYRHGSHQWVAGPDRQWLDHHRVTVRREQASLAEIGRFDRQQRVAAERTAQQARVRFAERVKRQDQIRTQQRQNVQDATRRQAEQRRDAQQERRELERQQQVQRQRDSQQERQQQQRTQQERQRLERQQQQQRQRDSQQERRQQQRTQQERTQLERQQQTQQAEQRRDVPQDRTQQQRQREVQQQREQERKRAEQQRRRTERRSSR